MSEINRQSLISSEVGPPPILVSKDVRSRLRLLVDGKEGCGQINLGEPVLFTDEDSLEYKKITDYLDNYVKNTSIEKLASDCGGENSKMHPSNLVTLFDIYTKQFNSKIEKIVKLVIVFDRLGRFSYVLKGMSRNQLLEVLQF